jgi:dihydroorotate dehydrogenase
MQPQLLPTVPDIPSETLRSINCDHDRFARRGLPQDLDRYLLETYGLEMTASYAGKPLRNPWGKASGQLSLNRASVEEAADAGLSFVVLKTVIAQDSTGTQAMSAWAIKESQMSVERIKSTHSAEEGWTVTWNGRGWWQTLDEYLDLVRSACEIGAARELLIVPSVKYHLPAATAPWRTEEYQVTTRAILDAFQSAGGALPMPLEKDLSPTLAGSDRAGARASVIEWIRRVPGVILAATDSPDDLRVGIKLFNSLEDDEFQLELLAEVFKSPVPPDNLVYANRLFNPDRIHEGKRGVAYGGPDLSTRNLRMLTALRLAQNHGTLPRLPIEVSATGNISSGRIAVEYALRGCTSFQIHTLFQLPASEFACGKGTKLSRALHRHYFDPHDGFIVWALHAARCLNLVRSDGSVRFLDLARAGAHSTLTRRDLDPKLA